METIADYFVKRFQSLGVHHLFGLPGTSCADFFDAAISGGMSTVVASTELEAGYAAEGYARRVGLSAVTVSYGVGTLNMANAIASAFTERSPVIVLNGGPSKNQLENEEKFGALFPHSTGRAFTDLEVFREICGLALRVEEASAATDALDRCIQHARRFQVPAYLEVPQDFWTQSSTRKLEPLTVLPGVKGHEEADAQRVADALSKAERPAVLLGVEIARYDLQSLVEEFIARAGCPFATTLLSKTVLSESHPSFIGVYDSGWAPKNVRHVVEGADLLLALGVNFGIDHLELLKKQQPQLVWLYKDFIRYAGAEKEPCDLKLFLEKCVDALPVRGTPIKHSNGTFESKRAAIGVTPPADGEITHDALFSALNKIIDTDVQVVMDTCLGSFPGADLEMKKPNSFEGNPVWLSIGHSVGAAIGVGLATKDRVLLICGDGGFQTIAQALSTIAKLDMQVLVVIIDNKTYAIEQYLIDGEFFTNPAHPQLEYVVLNDWDYCRVAEGMGFEETYSVQTLDELNKALARVGVWQRPILIEVNVPPRDLPAENRSNIP